MSTPLVILALLSLSLAAVSATTNVVTNPTFDQNLTGWETQGKAEYAVDSDVKHSGGQSARITVAPDAQLEYQQIGWSFPVKPGEEYLATFWVKCKNVKDGAGAYGVIEFWKGSERIGCPMGAFTRSEKWHQLVVEGTAPAGADRGRFAVVCHAHGTVWVDDVHVSPPPPQPAEANLRLRADKMITDNWKGFGCQGDLFLYHSWNTDQGLAEADRKLVLKRIRAMRPQIIRMVFNLSNWEAERGKRTPDTEGMKDLRRTIALYKEIGADIHLTEWGFSPPAWTRPTGLVPHPDEARAFAESFVAAVKYLREDCGFDNIRYVTIYNEPNGNPVPFKDYVGIYRGLDQALKDAGLRKEVSILGPDEANTYDWITWSIAELDDVIDYYDAHNYTSDSGRQFGAWVRPRIADMPRLKSSSLKPARKRLMIAEFGMHDRMETFSTPHNSEYEYGIFLADSAINAAAEGASALLMWCLMDTNYFADYRMKWGLWKFRDDNWEPRPGFYAWSLITRYTELGSTVHRVDSSVDDAVSVAFRAPDGGPWTILAVNRRKSDRPFALKGLPAWSRWKPYVYSQATAPTPNKEMIRPGQVVKANSRGRLTGLLPANSFVLWRQEL
ncbi:MAG: carbohydrate binding domain-containing protein [Armatimonadota bacterium]|nr:carbohydrate binding domain-containing protein [Armatimonadota bacterium]